MSYTTGTANDMVAVRQALIDACVADGWSWNSSTEVLSKGTVFVRLSVASGYLYLWGRISATEGEQPSQHKMGPFIGRTGGEDLPAFSWPMQYRIFTFPGEVYCLLQYAVDTFQWLAFGKSTVQGLPGCGTWIEGTVAGNSTKYYYGVELFPESGTDSSREFCPAPFWARSQESDYCSNVHSDLDGDGWRLGTSPTEYLPGASALSPCVKLLPNKWNSEAVFLPIRAYKVRPSAKVSLVVDLEHARATRVDNYAPAQIVSLGPDRWMVFPFFRKNTGDRDGGNNHSGTLGWAIRYEGA